MKTILPVVLLFLWLLHSSAAEPENQETLKKSEFNLVRDIREPGIRKNPLKNKKQKKKYKSKKKSKNLTKNKRVRKNPIKNKEQKNNNKAKKKSKGRKSRNGKSQRRYGRKNSPLKEQNAKKNRNSKVRQNTCSVTCVTDKQKIYNQYVNQKKKINIINRFLRLITNKKSKGKTAFDEAIKVIDEQTINGTSCNGGKPDSETMNAYYTLTSCPESTQKLCNYTLSSSDDSLISECEVPLDTYIADYEVCLTNTPTCVCFDALTEVDSKCKDFDPLLTSVKESKKICLDSTVNGSFVYCRKQEQLLPSIINKCNPLPPKQSTTTVSTPTPTGTTTAAAFTSATATTVSPKETNVEEALKAIVARHVIISQKLAVSNISNETALVIFPESDSCSFFKGMTCLSKLSGAVYTCYKGGLKGIVKCVEGIIGVGDDCYSCVCWAIDHIFSGACSNPSDSEDINEVLSSALTRHVELAEKIEQSGVLNETSLTIVPIPTPTCTVKQGLDCVAVVSSAVRDCYEDISKGNFTACIKEIVGVANSCYGCICWVIEHLGFYCDEDESGGLKLGIQYMSSSFVAYSQNIIDSGISTEMASLILPNSSECSIWTGAKCSAHVIWVVTECAVYINDGNLTACVNAIFGPSESCHDCICWVREFIRLPCTIDDADTKNLTTVQNSMANGIANFKEKVINSGISNGTDLIFGKCYPPTCDFWDSLYCGPILSAELAVCLVTDPLNLYACLERQNPPCSYCHGCLCDVVDCP